MVRELDLQSGSPEFKSSPSRQLDWFSVVGPEFKSSATLVNSQLVRFRLVGCLFDLFASVICSVPVAFEL